MALKRVSSTLPAATTAKKNSHPVKLIEGDSVRRYNAAYAASKEAEGILKLLRPEVEEIGLSFLTETNLKNPTNQVGTIKIKDASGAEIRVTSQDKYSAVDADGVSSLFENTLKRDVNNYFTETIKASFDNSFFLKDGEFDQAAFDALKIAVETVAKTLGKANPLTSKTVVSPKPGFHEKRYVDFNAAQNVVISSLVRNTVTMTPLATSSAE